MSVRSMVAAAAALSLLTSIAHATPMHVWSHRYAAVDDQWVEALAVDKFGNIVMVGSFYEDMDLDVPHASVGDRDVFIAKYSAAGNVLWSKQLGDAKADRGFDITTDPVGNIICVGHLVTSTFDDDGFVVKYAPDGTERFFKRYGANDAEPQIVMAVSTDLSKNIIIAGEFEGTIDLGGGELEETGGRTIFMAKLGQLGEHIWSKRFVTSALYAFNVAGLATGSDGRSVLTGGITGSVDFGNGPLTTEGNWDIFLAKFEANGNVIWANRYGGALDQFPSDLAMNESGQIALSASAAGPVNFGGGALTPTGFLNPCLVVFTPAGAHVWSKIFTGAGIQYGFSPAWASNQDVLWLCRGNGTLDFGGGGLTIPGPSSNLWVTRFFGANGNHRWSTTLVASGMDGQIEEDDGRIILAGGVIGTVNFGGGQTTGEAGFLDLYVATFGDALTGVTAPSVRAHLGQNVPNPFNPRTTIPFTLETPGRVQIGIYDAAGRVVTMLDAGTQAPGAHTVSWDGRDREGGRVSSGVYFYRLEGTPNPARKMVLLK